MFDEHVHPGQIEGHIYVYPGIGLNELGVLINPGKQFGARCRQPMLGGVRIKILLGGGMGNDFCTNFLKLLQAINMVSMVVRDNDVGNFKVGDFCNGLDQPLSQCGGTQGVHHNHPVFAHNESRIRNKVFIGLAAQGTLTLHVPHRRAYLLWHQKNAVFILRPSGCTR